MTTRNGSILVVIACATLGVPALLSVHGAVRQAPISLVSSERSGLSSQASPALVKPAVQSVPSAQQIAAADRKATQQIRKAILAQKNLSLYAYNCFISTRSGDVTLKGIVRSQAERQTVEQIAGNVVGTSRVHDALTLQTNP